VSEINAWCAGFFDGEGCIGLYLGKQWIASVSVSQRDEMPLMVFQQLFGGTKVPHGPKRDSLRIQFKKVEAWHMLNTLLPHLVVKRKQAELMLEFWQIENIKTGSGLKRAEAIAAEIKRLKRPWQDI
jgi:hypothetical protein